MSVTLEILDRVPAQKMAQKYVTQNLNFPFGVMRKPLQHRAQNARVYRTPPCQHVSDTWFKKSYWEFLLKPNTLT